MTDQIDMDNKEQIHELSLLVHKVTDAEDLVQRAWAYYHEHHQDWSKDVDAYFRDLLERKQDMIEYEWHRIERMGTTIASGRNPHRLDI